MKCKNCGDKGFLKQGNVITACPDCITPGRLIDCMKVSIDTFASREPELARKFAKIVQFLPEYPVMAVLEAEFQKIDFNFIEVLYKVFEIRHFK